MNNKYQNEQFKNLCESVVGKLKAENLSILSSWKEIEKCLSKTVSPEACITAAKYLRKLNTE